MPVAPRSCPLCGGRGRPLRRFADAGLVRCRQCRHVFSGSEPTADELTAYYASYPQDDGVHPLTRMRYDELLERLAPYRRANRLLDVGAGDGHFVRRAAEHGWEAHGTEFGEAKVAEGRAVGLSMHLAPWRPDDRDGAFDVITSFEVIEHLADPVAELEWMSRLVRSGGAVWLTTPNFSAVTRRMLGPGWRPIEYPEHLGYFTVTTLDRAARRVGLRRVQAQTTGLSAGASPVPAPAADGAGSDGPGGAAEVRLRSRMASSGALRRAVAVVNRALSATRSGETIKALYEKA